MPIFVRNKKELQNYLNDKLIKAMDRVGETALKHMKTFVDKQMQERVSEQSGLYDRTYEYLQSIEKINAKLDKTTGIVSVAIHYNTDKIHPYIIMDETGLWNKHADFEGNSVANLIPLFLEMGTDNPYYSHKPVGGIINLKEWVEDNFRYELKKELNKLGIKTK